MKTLLGKRVILNSYLEDGVIYMTARTLSEIEDEITKVVVVEPEMEGSYDFL